MDEEYLIQSEINDSDHLIASENTLDSSAHYGEGSMANKLCKELGNGIDEQLDGVLEENNENELPNFKSSRGIKELEHQKTADNCRSP